MLVTGGVKTHSTVSRYGKQGWIEDFSSGLKTGRNGHGCASYITKDNDENGGVEVVVGQKVEVLLGRYLYVRPDSDETQPNWKSNNSFVHRKGI